MSNIIAIGDIHGSAEWRNIVEENNDAMVVFLGDYLDPYIFRSIPVHFPVAYKA